MYKYVLKIFSSVGFQVTYPPLFLMGKDYIFEFKNKPFS